jgi:hypothetical protein
MRFFYDLFPEIAQKETLSVKIQSESVPDGIYSFLEYYCDNLDCRCTTVVLEAVFSETDNPKKGKHIGAINYEWNKPLSRKNPSFYKDETQPDMAQAAMTVFRRAMEQDSSYAKKLNNHFEMVRGYIQLEMQESPDIQNNVPKLGRNDPCHCGSGKKYKKCCLRK